MIRTFQIDGKLHVLIHRSLITVVSSSRSKFSKYYSNQLNVWINEIDKDGNHKFFDTYRAETSQLPRANANELMKAMRGNKPIFHFKEKWGYMRLVKAYSKKEIPEEIKESIKEEERKVQEAVAIYESIENVGDHY